MKKFLISLIFIEILIAACSNDFVEKINIQSTDSSAPEPIILPTTNPIVRSSPTPSIEPTETPAVFQFPLPSASPDNPVQVSPQASISPMSSPEPTPEPTETPLPIPELTPLPLPDFLVPTKGLIAYYPFNSNAIDSSNNGNNGTISGAVLTTGNQNKPNSAFQFNGESSFIEIDSNNINFINRMSVSLWLKIDNNFSKTPRIFSKSTDQLQCCDDLAVVLFPQGNQTYKFGYSIKSGLEQGKNKTLLKENVFYHIALIYDGVTFKYFVNGQLDFEENKTVVFTNDGSNIVLGKGRQSTNFFKGTLDNIRIYNQAILAGEVQAIYDEEKP